jgi:hypothetical protein
MAASPINFTVRDVLEIVDDLEHRLHVVRQALEALPQDSGGRVTLDEISNRRRVIVGVSDANAFKC